MGSRVREPVVSGASTNAHTSAKRPSVLFCCYSCPTQSRESRIDGTHRTPVIRKLQRRPCWSLAVAGMSPIWQCMDEVLRQPRDRLMAWAHVDEVSCIWMDVVGTNAVNDEASVAVRVG
eukprot:4824595-Pleurochrysis_carterae.AAC.3